MNVDLLRKIQERILKHPKQFHMESFLDAVNDDDPVDAKEILRQYKGKCHKFIKHGACNTTACIAGWALVCTKAKVEEEYLEDRRYFEEKGMKVLDLTKDQALSLFYNYNWPAKFQKADYNAKTNKARAENAVARIDHFIKTAGAD